MAIDIAAMRDRLLDEQGRLRQEIEEFQARERAEQDPTESHFGDGEQLADDAALATERETGQALRQNLSVVLNQVDHALDKIEHGTYGRCDDCGNEIPPKRLEALPHANLCVSCKSKAERLRH
jgi:RNA polymerase-binding protein DksA